VPRPRAALAATAGHGGLLGGAFVFQALGYAPCILCIWQRWPHAAAIALGVLCLAGLAPRATGALAGAAALTASGLGFFHAGVEQGWWDGPSACAGGASDLGAMSGTDLLSTDIAETVVMCTDIVWSFAGLSMAAWNGLLSLALAGLWLLALRGRRGAARRP
jgi:disulfide bond formation protein DsbB